MAGSTKTVRVELTGDPSSLERSLTVVSEKSAQTASKMEGHAHTIGGAFSNLDGLLGQFGVPFTGALSTIGGKLDELGTKGTTAFEKMSHAGGLALLGFTAAAVGIGIEGVHLADQFESAHARLEGAVKNTGGAWKDYAGRIDAVDKRLEQLGFNNTETEGALSLLTRASGDTGKALGLMGLAADIARARHLSLEQGVTLLSKVVTGHVALLGRYGIATKDAAGKTLSVGEAVDALQAKFGGQAQKSAETFQGKIKTLTAQLEDIGIKIGQFLIPVIEDLVSAITDVIGWFEKHKAAAIALAAVITGLLGAAIAIFVYDKIASFVGGIQRMISGLTALMSKSAETAAAVEADGAAMAESSAGGAAAAGSAGAAAGAEGAAASAEGAGVASGGSIAAAGEEATGAAAGFTALLGPVALVTGALLGAAYAAGYFKDGLEQTGVTTDMVASQSIPKLTATMNDLQGMIHQTAFTGAEYTSAATSMSAASRNHAASVELARSMHKSFNDVLANSPGLADKFIAAVQNAGGSTSWYTGKLNEHIAASLEAKYAQERFSLQLEIADAKARGDAAAVYGLTLQLNAIPTDTQVTVNLIDNATAKLFGVQDLLGKINGMEAVARVNVIASGLPDVAGIQAYLAGGGH